MFVAFAKMAVTQLVYEPLSSAVSERAGGVWKGSQRGGQPQPPLFPFNPLPPLLPLQGFLSINALMKGGGLRECGREIKAKVAHPL